jgi:hypothetical protein
VREDDPIQIDLLQFENAGTAELSYGTSDTVSIELRSRSESILALKIGGEDSFVPPNDNVITFAGVFRVCAFILGIFAALCAIAMHQASQKGSSRSSAVSKWEILAYSLVLLFSTTIVSLSFWPANVPYDGSLHWYQAVVRGELYSPLGVTATLFLRLIAYFSDSPVIAILLQSTLGALGVSLVLLELRHRGVPRWGAFTAVIILACLPQYSTFFTNLGKDAFCTVGLLFLTWTVLALGRFHSAPQVERVLLVMAVASAIFASVIRVNALPPAALAIILLGGSLFIGKQRMTGLALIATFILGVVFVPKLAISLSDEQSTVAKVKQDSKDIPITPLAQGGLPFGLNGNFYIYHFFAAAVHAGVAIDPEDERDFLTIASPDAWSTYHCYMTDTTFISISEKILLDQETYRTFLRSHQMEMAKAVLRILWRYPSVLFTRQACITKMLWSMEYGNKPFQATVTLGYDNVDPRFEALVGKNISLLPSGFRAFIQHYVWWTELKENFWMFWKPAYVLLLGLFCVLLRLSFVCERGLLFAVLIPLSSVAALGLLIPFPAYRYVFPSTLIMFLFSTLALSSAYAEDK